MVFSLITRKVFKIALPNFAHWYIPMFSTFWPKTVCTGSYADPQQAENHRKSGLFGSSYLRKSRAQCQYFYIAWKNIWSTTNYKLVCISKCCSFCFKYGLEHAILRKNISKRSKSAILSRHISAKSWQMHIKFWKSIHQETLYQPCKNVCLIFVGDQMGVDQTCYVRRQTLDLADFWRKHVWLYKAV